MTKTAGKHPSDIFSRTLGSGVWVFFTRVFLQFLTLVKTIVLGRLLLPSEFGVLAIAMLAIDALTTFTQTGFSSALIQKKESHEEFVDSAWTVSVVRGVVLFIILFFASPYIVGFFDSTGRFDSMDFPRPYVLTDKLVSDPNLLNQHLLGSLTEAGREKIKESKNIPSREMEILLADEFNMLSEKEFIYTSRRFENIPLSAYARSKIADSRESQLRLNRLLLEEAFPGEIKKRVLDVPQLTAILRVMAVLFLVYGFNNSRLFHLTRNLDFDKSFYLQTIPSFCALCVTIILAFCLRNVWALVWGQLFGAVLGGVLGYIVVPYRPRWDWDMRKARKLWSFGRHIAGMDIMTFLVGRGDSFFVGKILGMTAMGYYRYAIQLTDLITQEFSGMILMVSYPAFSQIQDNLSKIRNGYHKAMEVVNLVGFLICGLAIVLAPNLIEVMLGANWLPVIPIFRILALTGFVSALGQSRSVFLSLNRPDIQLKIILLRIGILLFLLYPLTKMMGVNGTAAAMVISRFMVIPVGFLWTKRMIQSGWMEFLKTAVIPAVAIILSAGSVWLLQRLSDTASIIHLAGLTGLGVIVYVLAAYVLDKIFNGSKTFHLFRDSIKTVKERTLRNSADLTMNEEKA